MSLALLALALTLAAANPSPAQESGPTGLWEAYRHPGNASGLPTRHLVLKIASDGSYELSVLSSDPEQPFLSQSGVFTLSDNRIELVSAIVGGDSLVFSYSPTDDVLVWYSVPSVTFSRGREIDEGLMVGRWLLAGPDGVPTGGEITLKEDGTYYALLFNGEEWGPYHIRGSGMVHWPTEATNDLLGIPGVWTNIQLFSERFTYEIIDGHTITAVRDPATAVALTSWGRLKVLAVP